MATGAEGACIPGCICTCLATNGNDGPGTPHHPCALAAAEGCSARRRLPASFRMTRFTLGVADPGGRSYSRRSFLQACSGGKRRLLGRPVLLTSAPGSAASSIGSSTRSRPRRESKLRLRRCPRSTPAAPVDSSTAFPAGASATICCSGSCSGSCSACCSECCSCCCSHCSAPFPCCRRRRLRFPSCCPSRGCPSRLRCSSPGVSSPSFSSAVDHGRCCPRPCPWLCC
mmetsp:Transcript_17322/g.52192  ORF Transcript_17322/g.52192 Transcript_17322/m.52192 type:complete len:228 (-) Transcript_17322:762-1445(-)